MKQAIKKAKRDPIIKNIKNLEDTIIKTQAKNNAKYNQIIKLNPIFEFKLFKPMIPSYQTRQQLSLVQSIMMKQIDRLMEDEDKLNIQLDKHQYKVKEQQRKIQKQTMLNMDHFTFLRKIWKKDQAIEPADNKVDKLIHNVGSIKGHILNLIKKQSKLSQSSPQIRELIVSSPQYSNLLKKHEQLKAEYEKLFSTEKQQYTNTSQSSIQNQDYKKQNEQLEAQVAKLKLQLLNKNKQIQRIKRDNKRTSGQLSNIINNGNLNNQGQSNNITKYSGYKTLLSDGSYQLTIKQTKKSQQQQQKKQDQMKQNQNIKQFQTKISVEEILKFLQGNSNTNNNINNNIQSRKLARISLVQNNQSETRAKKYTVQQIARPKFISTKQIAPTKIPQNSQILQ